MPRPLREELREELLELAAREFARLGYHPVRLEDIAARAGVTKGAVYFHFRGKMELFLSALERLEELRGEAALPEDPVVALRRLLVDRLEFHAAHPELRRLQWILDTELGNEPAAVARDGIRAEYRDLRATLRHLLQQAARAGRLEPQDPADEAFRLAACLEGTLSQHSASPDDVGLFWDPERIVEGWLAPTLRRRRRPAPTPEPPPEEPGEDFQPAF